MTHDNPLPGDNDLAGELAAYHYRASKGEIQRGGVCFDAERDYFTRTVLLAQVKELHELLHVATAECDRLATELASVVDIQRTTADVAMSALAECDRLAQENHKMQTELLTAHDIATTIKERPVASALLLLATHFFPHKETEQ